MRTLILCLALTLAPSAAATTCFGDTSGFTPNGCVDEDAPAARITAGPTTTRASAAPDEASASVTVWTAAGPLTVGAGQG